MKTLPTAHLNLTPQSFPVVIEALHPVTRKVVWTTTLDKPNDGAFVRVYVPPLAKRLGHPVAVRVRFADGREDTREPDGEFKP